MICKLLERLIKDHMLDFRNIYKLLNPSQHGFLKARSCLANIIIMFFWKKLLIRINEGSPVDMIYLD